MREIKFRALYNGKWVYSDSQNDGKALGAKLGSGIISAFFNHMYGQESLCQYIGVKDKNGIEIYEGDICRILYSDYPSNTDPNISLEDYLVSISHIGYIEYDEAGFYIMLKDRYDDYSASFVNTGKHGFVEVLGNIYQNPELLNK